MDGALRTIGSTPFFIGGQVFGGAARRGKY